MKLTMVRTPAGNFGRLRRGLERAGAKVVMTSPRALQGRESALVIAGVSSFTTLAESVTPASRLLRSAVRAGTPLLGVCAGMQVLFQRSEEGPGRGLALLPGGVRRLQARRVPNLGWSRLLPDGDRAKGLLMEDVPEGSYAYFAHTYRVPGRVPGVVASSEYIGERFPAAVERGNLWGLQFHPEISSLTGARVLRNFVAQCEEVGR